MIDDMTPDYTNRNVRAKRFTVDVERDRSGNYTVVGARITKVTNQYESRDYVTDKRELTRDMRRKGLQVA